MERDPERGALGRRAGWMEELPPELANHPGYELKKELGRGGMGVVYLAHNRLLRRDEVLKVMGRHIMERPGVLDRFLREIRLVARLRHPNIVTAYSALRVGENLVLAMEYVEGLDLAKMVKAKGPLPVAHACNFVQQAALGLQHAHEERLVHRDIKPANLMLSRKRDRATVKVLDFGLARVASEEKVEGGLTSQGQALGTPDFIAPEQVLDAMSADIRADIYSLGGTLFYLLAGRAPFNASSLYDLYQAHISREADPLNLVRPEVPTELAAVVSKMMAKDPARRFQTPGEVAQALTPFFQRARAAFSGPGTGIFAEKDSQADTSLPPKAAQETKFPSRETPLESSSVMLHSTPTAGVAPGRWESMISMREVTAPASAISENTPRQVSKRVRFIAAGAFAALLGLVVLAAILKRMASDGVIVLENLPAGAAVNVDGATVSLPVLNPGKAVEIKVGRGPRRLEINKHGFVTFTRELSIESGGREPVAVDLKPVKPGEPMGKPITLFNGRDLTGWVASPYGAIRCVVEDGVLRSARNGRFYTERDDFTDFRLTAELKADANCLGNLLFRTMVCPGVDSTYGVAINTLEDRSVPIPSGSIMVMTNGGGHEVLTQASHDLVHADQWFTLELTVKGGMFVAKINGVEVASAEDPSGRWVRGSIALHRDYRSRGGELSCRKLEIEELAPEPGVNPGWGALASFKTGMRYRLVNKKSGLALSVINASADRWAHLCLAGRGEDDSQKWGFVKALNGECQIVNCHSRLAIDVPNNRADAGLELQQFSPGHANPAQLWQVVPLGECYQFLSRNGLALAVGARQGDGAPVVQIPSTGVDEELWRLEELGIVRAEIESKTAQ